jgi:hypothetical protein
MKVMIQLGENKFEFDDGIGSITMLEHTVDSINNLLKAVYPEDMVGMKLIVLDEDFANDITQDMENMEEAEGIICEDHKNLNKGEDKKSGPNQN